MTSGKPEVYQTFPNGYVVRSMTKSDTKIVQKWWREMLSFSRYDLEVAMKVFSSGKGYYIGEYEGEVVASAVRVPWGPDIYYGGYYYVAMAHRGKGFGKRLRDQVQCGTSHVCIDSVIGKAARDNEEKFGYMAAFQTAMFTGAAKIIPNSTTNNIVMASSVPFEKLTKYDDRHFVTAGYANRHEFLKRFCEVQGAASYLAVDAAGNIRGYGLRRPCMKEQAHMVGPLYADDTKTAIAIMNMLSSDVTGETITICICMPNEDALSMVKNYGLEKENEFCRMHLNGHPNEYKPTVYGITSIMACGF